jgi:hypothetical protein
MALMHYKEYLEKNGKVELQKQAIVSLNGDTSKFPKEKAPGKAETKSKSGHWHTEAAVVDDDNGPLEYMGPGKDPGLQMAGDGGENSPPLGSRDVPQSGMVYHPKTDPYQNLNVDIDTFTKTKSVNYKANAPAKTVDQGMPTPPRPFDKAEKPFSPTENFIHHTSKLTPEQYANLILKTNGNSIKDITEVTTKIGKNLNLLETFVREVKRKGNFAELMQAILNQPEAYQEFAIAIASDTSKARQVAKFINETTAPPVSEDEDDEEDEKQNPNMVRNKDKVQPKPASQMMPPDNSQQLNSPPANPSNVPSAPEMRPEHAFIQALAGYKNIRHTMQEILGQ